MPYDNRDTGTIQRNQYKKKPNHPDFRGRIILSTDTLRELVARAKQGVMPMLSLSGWTKETQNGKFVSLAVQVYEERQGQGQGGGYQQQGRGGYQQQDRGSYQQQQPRRGPAPMAGPRRQRPPEPEPIPSMPLPGEEGYEGDNETTGFLDDGPGFDDAPPLDEEAPF